MLRVEKEKRKGKTVEGHVHPVGSIAVKLANGRHNYLSETARWNRSWRALISIPPLWLCVAKRSVCGEVVVALDCVLVERFFYTRCVPG